MNADSYQLGVDIGTTWTAAAVARDGQVRMVGLGNRSAAVPSVVHLGGDGAVVVGDAAERRAVAEPERVAREFKRRLGDPTPLRLGDTACTPDTLLGTLLDAVVARVTELEGGPPSHLVVTHPANWGGYKQDLFDECVAAASVAASCTATEPEAAAIAYAANERVAPGSLIAVYDLGGGTFDVAVMRKTSDGFSILGRPEGVERLGGIDVDEAVLDHVRTALGGAIDDLDLDDTATVAALTRLRRDCVEAKEALSTDTEVTIPVLLPGIQTEVRLTRAELERVIRPALETSIDAMRRALAAAAIMPEHLSTILLVGGSSRIPLVAELVSEAFGRPVALDAHPKHAVATGAALLGAMEAASAPGSPDARVIPFASTAATGAYDAHGGGVQLGGDDTAPGAATRSTDAGAGAAGPDTAGPGATGPADEVPDEVPDWLLDARDEAQPSRWRRVLAAAVAVVALTVVAAGAGALSARSGREAPSERSAVQPDAATSEPAGGHASEAVAGASSDDDAQQDRSRKDAAEGTGGTADPDDAADDAGADPGTSADGGADPASSPSAKAKGDGPKPSPSPTAGSGGGPGGGGAEPSPSPSPTTGSDGGSGGGAGDGSGSGGAGGGSGHGSGDGSGSGGGSGSGTGSGDGSGTGTGDGSGSGDGGGSGGGPAPDPGTDSSAGSPVPVTQS